MHIHIFCIVVSKFEGGGLHTYIISSAPVLVRVDLGVLVMKGCSTHPRAPELNPHHDMLFCVISRIPLFV